MDVRTHRTRFFAGLATLGLALSSIAPSYAQSAPIPGTWTAGPDAKGVNSIIGRIESPRARQVVNSGANVLVSGWAADTTAAGWAGIDGVEVWSGAKPGGTKLVSGSAGLSRAGDIGEALGRGFNNSGFSVVIPGSTWATATNGVQTIYVYLHTPDKGTYYRTVPLNVVTTAGINLATGTPLMFPTDPMISIARPQENMNITQKQANSKFTFSGFALDRNPIVDPKIQLSGPGCSACNVSAGTYPGPIGAGISLVTAYIDTPPVRGDNSQFGGFGIGGSAGLYANILVPGAPPLVGPALNRPGRPQGSIITRQFGSQFDFSGWSISINPTTLTPGPHTLYVTATSSVTGALDATNKFVGKTTTASVHFNILDLTHKQIQPDPLLCGPAAAKFFC